VVCFLYGPLVSLELFLLSWSVLWWSVLSLSVLLLIWPGSGLFFMYPRGALGLFPSCDLRPLASYPLQKTASPLCVLPLFEPMFDYTSFLYNPVL
jgi:hypothetical protein